MNRNLCPNLSTMRGDGCYRDPATLPQLLLDVHVLLDEWDSRMSNAKQRNYSCNRWFLRNLRNLKDEIKNLSDDFSQTLVFAGRKFAHKFQCSSYMYVQWSNVKYEEM